MLNLALLGCGGSLPEPSRFLSSLLLSINGRKILVDCGEGTQVSMKILGWGFKTIDIICITHFHADHVLGLPGILLTMANSDRRKPVYILGPKGIKHIVSSLCVLCPFLPFELKIIEITKDTNSFDLDYLNISTLELDHSISCIGYSFYVKRKRKFDVTKAEKNNVPKQVWKSLQNGKSEKCSGIIYVPEMVLGDERRGIKVSYVTDTSPIKQISEFVKDSDLFICEGTYGNSEDRDKAIKNKHMTFSDSATLALNGNVKELWLTHFSPSMDNPDIYLNNAKEIFENTIIGKDRMHKEISFEK